jgi:hypothetical protein
MGDVWFTVIGNRGIIFAVKHKPSLWESLMSTWAEFVKSLPIPAHDPLKEIRDALKDGDLADADNNHIWIEGEAGGRRLDIDGGVLEEHYRSLLKLLDDDQKAPLALGVLENAMQPLPSREWDVARTLLRKKHSKDTDTDGMWLPALVKSKGFDAISNELKNDLAAYRKTVRPGRLKVVVVDKPHWDGQVLSIGGKMWPFHRHNGPVNQLLDELEIIKWLHPVKLPNLKRGQVTEAARVLRDKTKGYIKWHAGKNRELAWSLP